MFRRTYDSLSMPTHLELLVRDDVLCLKNWMEITEDQYNMEYTNSDYEYGIEDNAMVGIHEKSLYAESLVKHMAYPADNTGIFHSKLPTSRVFGDRATGEELHTHMPDNIKGSYGGKMAGKYFRCVSYSWIDPSDPSMNGGENSDAACWVIGVGFATMASVGEASQSPLQDRFHYTQAAFNAISYSHNNKTHPLRSSRQYGAPAALFCYRPFTDTAFTDCSYTLKYNKGYGFSTNLDGWTNGSGYNYVADLGEALPSFNITSGGGSIDADGYDTVNFTMVDSDGNTINHATDVYLEHTGGYLPHHRVSITDGTGSFKVGALGMTSGDTFRVKMGFRSYSGLTDVNYTVS